MERVDIGGRLIEARVRGTGQPVIVFENGAGSPSYGWEIVQDELASDFTTLSYNRAGLGQSTPDTKPRTATAVNEDLMRLLTALDLKPPYVLVGHSMGGLYVRTFQASHPDLVGAMVLADAIDSETIGAINASLRWYERAALKVMNGLPGLADQLGLVALISRRQKPPASMRDRPEMLEARDQFWRGRNCQLGNRQEQRWAKDVCATVRALPSLGDLPLAVISAGEFRGQLERIRDIWGATQDRNAALSTRSISFTADGAGHFVQLERPDVVVDAVRRVIAQIG